jgi:hypothetical protein
MPVATNPLMDVLWTILISSLWVVWFALLYRVIVDIFRRHDFSGWRMTAWIVVAILLPFLGVFVYMATQKDGMTERKRARAAAKELEEAEFLRDIGSITEVELDAVRRKAAEHQTGLTESVTLTFGRRPEYRRAAPIQHEGRPVQTNTVRETVGVRG